MKLRWLRGWSSQPNERNPHRSNFAAPYSAAWRTGRDKRHELEAALNGGKW